MSSLSREQIRHKLELRLKPKMALIRQKVKDFRAYDLAGFSINGLTPKRGFAVQRDIVYGSKPRQRLDLYKTDLAISKSLIVFVHGGAWRHGDKSAYHFVGEAFARFGHDVAVVNYHLAPEHIFPSYVDDLVVALDFLEAEQLRLTISTQKIILIGHSAGAFNIASLLYHPKAFELSNRANIKALIGIAGPYHFDYKGDTLAEHAFDASVNYQQVMPYYFVEKNKIQHYLLVAENDSIVKHSNSEDFQTQLLACGNHCELITVPNTGHISIMGSISSLFDRFFMTRTRILEAIDQSLAD